MLHFLELILKHLPTYEHISTRIMNYRGNNITCVRINLSLSIDYSRNESSTNYISITVHYKNVPFFQIAICPSSIIKKKQQSFSMHETMEENKQRTEVVSHISYSEYSTHAPIIQPASLGCLAFRARPMSYNLGLWYLADRNILFY